MSNQHGTFLKDDLLVRAMNHYRKTNQKFTNGKKLAKALGISTYKAGQIFRILEFKLWTDATSNNAKRCYVVPKEYRTNEDSLQT